MTRISSIFVVSALTLLPISAFAQQDTVQTRSVAPNTAVSPMAPSSTAPSNTTAAGNPGKPVAKVAPAKADMQTSGGKAAAHGVNIVKSHNGRTEAPASMKAAEPSKS